MKRIFVYEYLSGGGETAPGELLAMGQSMRDAIMADLLRLGNHEVSVATCQRASPVPEPARPVTPRDGESAFDFVARQADAHDLAWVVAPETDGLLARLHQCVDPGRWLGCDGPAIELATRKRMTLMTLAEAGIATPLAFDHAPETTRWVVKPDDGAGAVATRLHHDPAAAVDDWSARSRAGSPMAIEPWVDGMALSLSLLCGRKRCELLSINRQHLDIDAQGLLSFRGVEVNTMPLADPRATTLGALAARVHQVIPGLRGFVGIDLVWHERRGPVVIEINPRVTCAYVGLSRALGRNLASEVIAMHVGERASSPKVAHIHV
ncbi:ATP-grasp domain-containing protein [Variovorax sp. J2P1-59]|uniref:ATP-grasp domain-containing protein n=1 Tax=Variovorax flavidus TaxID=3053501 RepID=UPI002575FB51|nr:ATP-grasp domain-containing protein [Variovorax sp. J2P1-59]MDM0073261.1 ATP-grasp domain-containing protein [Variovorax sp. J2P1-59]